MKGVRSSYSVPAGRTGRTASVRLFHLGIGLAGLSLLLFVCRTLIAEAALESAALAALTTGILCGWVAVLLRRMPVLPARTLLFLGICWIFGLAAAALLLLGSLRPGALAVWSALVQSLALSLSLLLATALFRSLLHRRRRLLLVRLLSLLSPLGIAALLILLTSARP